MLARHPEVVSVGGEHVPLYKAHGFGLGADEGASDEVREFAPAARAALAAAVAAAARAPYGRGAAGPPAVRVRRGGPAGHAVERRAGTGRGVTRRGDGRGRPMSQGGPGGAGSGGRAAACTTAHGSSPP
ncbi:hypothetical protein NKH77_31830 [Streptomyces sp. M19]